VHLRSVKGNRSGITFAFALLIIFIVVFVAGIAYLASPIESNSPHTYFEGLNFTLAIDKSWRVGVPVTGDGALHLAISSNQTVELYVKNANGYLLDRKIIGNQQITLQVTASMGVLEVGLRNVSQSSTVSINQFTCIWTR
jgi:uncharacterized protein (UPF0333 family)